MYELLSLCIGFSMGIGTMCLMYIAKKADEDAQQIANEQKTFPISKRFSTGVGTVFAERRRQLMESPLSLMSEIKDCRKCMENFEQKLNTVLLKGKGHVKSEEIQTKIEQS